MNSQLFSKSRTATLTVESFDTRGWVPAEAVIEERHVFSPFGHHRGGPVVYIR